MMYLYSTNKSPKKVNATMQPQLDNKPSLHQDNLDDIDRRKEPMQSVQEQHLDPASRYTPDVTTDPEILERQFTGNDLPAFVYVHYDWSPTSLWGKKWQDGREHLVPKKSAVDAVIAIHEAGQKSIGKMLELANADSNKANMKILADGYRTMFLGVDKTFTFPMMRALGQLTQAALADRAFQKWMYADAATRIKQDEPEPEWFLNMRGRMLQASAIAGTWVNVHAEAWSIMEYKNSPTYNGIANDIRLRLVNQAKWLENTYAPKRAETPTTADNHALVDMC